MIEVRKDGKTLDKQTLALNEGENKVIVLAENKMWRIFYFPISVEYLANLPYIAAGADFYVLPDWKITVQGGGLVGYIPTSTGTTNLFGFCMNASTGYNFFEPIEKLKIGANAGVYIIFWDKIGFVPSLNIEAQYENVFIRIGAGYNINKTKLQIIAGGGIRF